MLTKADDYPIHQTAEPIACTATSDRNFYDRYFFNGYARDGSTFFAAALGLYPNRQVMDAAFSVVHEGIQYVLRASRLAPMERLDTQVGPIQVQVLEPLSRLRLLIAPNEHGISGQLEFLRRGPALEEPRFLRRAGNRVWMDSTRLTQHGSWTGTLHIGGRALDVGSHAFWGSRDRSWGVRPVGEREAGVPALPPQFFWLWAPLNFDTLCTHFDVNEEADGKRWHAAGMILQPGVACGGEEVVIADGVDYHLALRSGTRHAERASIAINPGRGGALHIDLQPLYNFYMIGLGYGHPTWGHGMFVGENRVSGESWKLADIDPTAPMHLHVQAVCTAECDGQRGIGVLEQLILGPHQPTGLRELFDGAP